ncbi:MAG: acetyl-CoA hydrolase/transferase family protein [Deltaproteobacteria bacterium]|jgi:acyl-CoA hydrolase|nr:acetyl-CoA hydrolase/transferase family protein [Deltaproteobacteria bacterium]MBW2537549.1 acetyl-CoA hydrolase/transferase family protein [Deltaproteobacteria bacterium]
MSWLDTYKAKVVDARTALERTISAGDRVMLNANCGEPQTLAEAFAELAPDLRDVEVVQLLALGKADYVRPELAANLRLNALFIGPGVRRAVNEGDADYTPVFLSEIPALFDHALPLDVALIQVSPPDEHGFCSFGVSVDVIKPAAERSKVVIAEVNEQMPRTLGDCFIHVSKLTYAVEVNRPLLELPQDEFTDVHRRIGTHIAELIDDGATLQLGIGAIPDAVLSQLKDKRHIGIHTEMFADGVVELFEAGVITNEKKTLHPGKIVSSFVMGSRKLYDFVDNNPVVEMHPSHYVNDPFVVAKNDNMVSINSAISIDLTGQVNSDSVGTRFYSGIGGQVDFVRGAQRADNGKAIIAFPSTAKDGELSRIVPTLLDGAGVVTSRGDVNYVVTEYGVAQLHGKSIRERARALINIAHPTFRQDLERFAHDHKYL